MSTVGKVTLSSKVPSRPAGDPIGTYPQTTAPNPSQANGNSPPTVPASHLRSGMGAGPLPGTAGGGANDRAK
jgi:hypothetical protein